ncbi:mediator of RNA polymerase II transcription subunit 8 [Podospora australis]|uniref:Mediator of RNA polymerase II transcription subunit 8 n=1 Tax=Podospora australis TaxID=1536484 RepID=A0AAN7AM71_9PEZI|nr:mediator of RNA polymerase II transcription subunit 8 [Podospora australis]
MASLGLAPEELKHLEVLRNRLAQLNHNILSVHKAIATTYPLPSRESFQTSTSILQRSILSIQEILTENHDLFQRIAVHPSTNFPGRLHRDFLGGILRKKPEPEIETAVEESLAAATAAGITASDLAKGLRKRRDDDDDDDYEEEEGEGDPTNEKWADCRYTFDQALQHYGLVQERKNFTVEEQSVGIGNVRTGLKRDLKEEEEEEEEESGEEESSEDEEMGGQELGMGIPNAAAQPNTTTTRGVGGGENIQPEHLLWLAARGGLNLPKNIELEATRGMKRSKGRGF